MRRILIIASTFPKFKGDNVSPFVLQIATAVAKLNNEVHVLAPHGEGAEFNEKIGDVEVHRFRYFWPDKFETISSRGGIIPTLREEKLKYLLVPFFIGAQIIAAIKLALKLKFNLINPHWVIPQGLTGFTLKKLFGTPYVVSIHGGAIFALQQTPLIKLKRLILNNANAVTANSSVTLNATKELAPTANYHLVHTGVDCPRFSTPSPEKKRIKKVFGLKQRLILFVGRLVEEKGVGYLIEAIPKILKESPNCKLLIIGEGKDKSRFQEKVKKLNLTDSIKFLGWIDNEKLPAYYQAADIFVAPSVESKEGWKEAMGVVFLEAMSAGTPVVGTDLGGVRDVITPGKTGLLVEPRNSLAIARAVMKVFTEGKFKNRIVKNAKEKIRTEFDYAVIGKRFNQAFEGALKRK